MTRPPIFKTDEEEREFLQPAFDDVDAGRTISHEELKRSMARYKALTKEEVIAGINEGLADIDAGRTIPHSEVKRRLSEFLAKEKVKEVA